MSRGPDLFVAGAPKCGTTTLWSVLDAHPGVAMSFVKEPRFFELHWHRGRAWYEGECFPSVGDDALLGEASPMYLTLPWVPPPNRGMLPPGARRGDAARASGPHGVGRGGCDYSGGREDLGFDPALAANLSALDGDGDLDQPDAEARWRDAVRAIEEDHVMALRTYIQSSLYGRNLERLYESVPSERVHVIFTEALKTDPRGELDRLSAFLGLTGPALEIAHSNPAIAPAWAGLVRRLAPLKRRGFMPRWVIDAGRRVAAGGRRPSGIADPALRDEVHRLVRDDLERLLRLHPTADAPRAWLEKLG